MGVRRIRFTAAFSMPKSFRLGPIENPSTSGQKIGTQGVVGRTRSA
jgi:hypothetical protein